MNKVIYESATGIEQANNVTASLTNNSSPQATERSVLSDRSPERVKLQELVKDFAKLAVRGVNCQMICGQTGRLYSSTYYVDGMLERLSVLPENPEDPPHELPMTSIRDFHDHESGRSVAGEAVIWASKCGKKEHLIIIEPADPKQPPVFLVEASPLDRDRFIMCMKVLRLYAIANINSGFKALD